MKRPTPEEIRAALDPGTLPEPPAGLTERIKREIPPALPRREAPARWGGADWLRLAATLVLVSGGVLLGYKLAVWMWFPAGARQETIARLVPRANGSIVLPTDGLPVQAVPAAYISTKESPRSTWGANADPFPEAEARRWLEQGKLPPADAVPPLSWAGYFDPGGDPGEPMVLEGGPSPLNPDPSYRLLRVTVAAPLPPKVPRPPMDVTVMLDLREANGQLEMVERSLREAAAGLQAHDRLRMVYERELDPERAHAPGVRLKERQEFVFIGDAGGSAKEAAEPVRRMIRITRSGPPFVWIPDETGGAGGGEMEVRTIVLRAPEAPEPPAAPLAPVPPAPMPVGIPPDELPDTLRATVRALAGGREVWVEFNPRAVEYYRLIGQGRGPSTTPDGTGRMVALYEIKLNPRASEDAVVATLRLDEGSDAAVKSLELRHDEIAASMEKASAGLKAAALSARVTEMVAQEKALREINLRELEAEVRRLAGEKVLLERQAKELRRLVEIAARDAAVPKR
jgi:hypothetical protein